MQTHFQTLTAEPDGDEVRIESLNGDPHVVAPVVMVREGVLNGGFLSYDEIKRSVPGWNGEPFTVPPARDSQAANALPDGVEPSGHPMRANDDGEVEFASANDPQFMEDMQTGYVLNVEADDEIRGARGEIWLNVERSKELGEPALETARRLVEGEELEVSTGYFHAYKEETGTHDGDRYEAVQFDLLPDHLAGLPSETGACSWEDGCGAPRVNAETALAVNEALETDALDPDDAVGDAGNPMTALERIRATVNDALGRGDAAPCGAANCGDSCECGGTGNEDEDETTETQNMTDYDIESLAEASAFDAQTLESWDDDELEALAETVEDDGGDDPENTTGAQNANDDADGGEVEALREQVSTLTDTVEDMRSELEANQKRTEYDLETLAAATGRDVDELETLDEDALEVLADTVGGCGQSAATMQGNAAPQGNRVNFVGQAGGTEGDDGADVEGYTSNVGALATLDEQEQGENA